MDAFNYLGGNVQPDLRNWPPTPVLALLHFSSIKRKAYVYA